MLPGNPSTELTAFFAAPQALDCAVAAGRTSCLVTIAEKQERLVAELRALKTAQDRLAYLVRRGRRHPALDTSLKIGAHRVEGCLANIWFIPSFANGLCRFEVDSDSAVIKGIAVVLCDLYSGQTPQEILAASPAFLEEFGITQHLTPNRRNSLSAVARAIQTFARSRAEKS
jgi:cysteine desulfuration protein SufE